MNIGFTGTRRGMTQAQKCLFRQILTDIGCSTFSHGDCIGADADAHDIADDEGLPIIIHPPENSSKRAFKTATIIMPERPYLVRNHAIVDTSHHLIACPGECEEQLRSGTWATVRYARKVKCPLTIIFPDGATHDQ